MVFVIIIVWVYLELNCRVKCKSRRPPDTFRLNVVWVVLYSSFVLYIDSIDKFKSLMKTMVWAVIAISIYNIALVLSVFDYIPNLNLLLQIDDEMTSAIGIHEGFIQLTSNNVGSLAFLAPFVLVLYVMKCGKFIGISNRLLLFSVILSIITVLISGRRALYIAMFVTPFLILYLNNYFTKNKNLILKRNVIKFYSILMLSLGVCSYGLIYYLNWDVAMFFERFTNAFESGNVRSEQAMALYDGFTKSPIIGSGFGIGVQDVVRSDLRPWTYELSYAVILYNTGLLGSLLYVICMGIIFRSYFKFLVDSSFDNGITSSLLIAFAGFMIANSTNPYLGSYDYMWMLYIPIMYINVVKLDVINRYNGSNLADAV